jgi:hypothetical protein
MAKGAPENLESKRVALRETQAERIEKLLLAQDKNLRKREAKRIVQNLSAGKKAELEAEAKAARKLASKEMVQRLNAGEAGAIRKQTAQEIVQRLKAGEPAALEAEAAAAETTARKTAMEAGRGTSEGKLVSRAQGVKAAEVYNRGETVAQQAFRPTSASAVEGAGREVGEKAAEKYLAKKGLTETVKAAAQQAAGGATRGAALKAGAATAAKWAGKRLLGPAAALADLAAIGLSGREFLRMQESEKEAAQSQRALEDYEDKWKYQLEAADKARSARLKEQARKQAQDSTPASYSAQMGSEYEAEVQGPPAAQATGIPSEPTAMEDTSSVGEEAGVDYMGNPSAANPVPAPAATTPVPTYPNTAANRYLDRIEKLRANRAAAIKANPKLASIPSVIDNTSVVAPERPVQTSPWFQAKLDSFKPMTATLGDGTSAGDAESNLADEMRRQSIANRRAFIAQTGSSRGAPKILTGTQSKAMAAAQSRKFDAAKMNAEELAQSLAELQAEYNKRNQS